MNPSCRLSPLRTIVALLLAVTPVAALHAQLQSPPEPPGNPVTVAKARLGKALFWDEQMSSTRTVACGTCHHPDTGGADPRTLGDPSAVHPGADGTFGTADDVFGSPGVPLNLADGSYDWQPSFGLTEQVTPRRSPSFVDAGYSLELFWDGRAGEQFVDPISQQVVLPAGAALESQAVGPPVSTTEMGHVDRDWADVAARIQQSRPLALAESLPAELVAWIGSRAYPELFAEAFGTPQVDAARIAMAIATYERTLFSDRTVFDLVQLGLDELTPLEEAGSIVFTDAGCGQCHAGILFSDNNFHYIGVRPNGEDPGRFEVTGNPDALGAFRTPSLRNVELRAPYMRNGGFDTLAEVVEFYDRGGDFEAPNKDPRIIPLGLTQGQKDALIAFLERPMTDARVAAETAPFDRPTLYAESARVPVVEGSGVAGSGGFEPRAVALEPPFVGNPSFTVGVWAALGGAQATLAIDTFDPGLTTPASASFAFETIALGGVGAGMGFGSVSLSVPSSTAAGQELFGRWYVADPAAAGGVAVTPRFRFSLFEAEAGALFADGFESGDLSGWSLMVD